MAYFKITKSAKGELQARIQVSCKNTATGKKKIFTKRIYNKDKLTEAKFKKFVEKTSFEFEEKVIEEYERIANYSSRVLSFPELAKEWRQSIKLTLSHNYYLRAGDIEKKFNNYLMRVGLYNKPITDIKVRDIQLFINENLEEREIKQRYCEVIKELPSRVKCKHFSLNERLTEKRAQELCEKYDLYYNKYFKPICKKVQYSLVTVKGFRRILRTIFNEAVRYEWISKNPVCLTKVTAKGNNGELIPITEKEVFTIKESKAFLKSLDQVGEEFINKVIPIKIMLLTGLRNGEIHGLKWSDIDFKRKTLTVKRSRLYSPLIGCYEKSPKTSTSTREVPLPDSLINDLENYKDWFRIMDEDFDNKLDQYYISVNMYREPINPEGLGDWLNKFEMKTNQKHVTCHGLRHTYCSILLSQGVPIQTVSKYMGHSDSSITLKVYSHFMPESQDITFAVLNKFTNYEIEDEDI